MLWRIVPGEDMPPLKYFVPNGFTALSLVLGLASVAMSVEGNFELAAWMILWGTLLDKLDGSAARLLGATSKFGVEFDSFADFVSFGIAPAALVYFRVRTGGASPALVVGACVYVVALAVRLSRFNVTTGGEDHFSGIPGTLMGAIIAAGYLTWGKYQLPEIILRYSPALLIIAAALMVSNLRLPKLKMRKSRAFNLFQIANIVLVYIAGPLRMFPEYLLSLALVYLGGGLIAGMLTSPAPVAAEAAEAEEEDEEQPAEA
jgi:CDP-diacylglycerol---serine O-phosphatidyltransferase